MADITKRIVDAATALSQFRFVNGIDSMSDEQLNKFGYYRGFPCPHNHTIRDLEKHWCYECARKIQNNNCGFDINYLNANYKAKYLSLWKQIPVQDFSECWEAPWLAHKRICFPSYRSGLGKQHADNINAHKVMYQCAWGDVGKMFVTRVCKNKTCLNPLHLISSWNRTFPPESIHPFHYEFDPRKLMQFSQNNMRGEPEHLLEKQYKSTIQHPLVHKNTPDYDDTQELYYGSYVQEFGKSTAKNSE